MQLQPPLSLTEAPVSPEVDNLAAALQDTTRRRILLALLNDGRPRTVDDAASLVGVHRTVAFTHLERLVALGYLAKTRRRGLPGKPASLYQVRRPFLEVAVPARQFLVLAGLLGSTLASLGRRGAEAAREKGRAFGRTLADARAASASDAVRPLNRIGALYSVEAGVITTAQCVFREACDEARDVVCGIHAGMLEGVFEGAGMSVVVSPRGPVSATGCCFTIREAAATG